MLELGFVAGDQANRCSGLAVGVATVAVLGIPRLSRLSYLGHASAGGAGSRFAASSRSAKPASNREIDSPFASASRERR